MPAPFALAKCRDGEARADHCVEKGLPAGACGSFVAIALRLLEGVVDGDWEGRVRLLGKAVHRLRHAVEKERLCLFLAAVAVGRSDQLLGLWHGQRGEEVGEDRLQRAAQPDVEEVREIGIADVVVVGWIGGDKLAERTVCARIRLCAASATCLRKEASSALISIRPAEPVAALFPNGDCLCVIPCHRDRLSRETCCGMSSSLVFQTHNDQ